MRYDLCHIFFKRGGLLIGWIQVLVSAPSVTPANFTKEASYCAHLPEDFFLSDFQMNMKIKQARLLFFGFYESWFGT